jgi:hypothetical protein
MSKGFQNERTHSGILSSLNFLQKFFYGLLATHPQEPDEKLAEYFLSKNT